MSPISHRKALYVWLSGWFPITSLNLLLTIIIKRAFAVLVIAHWIVAVIIRMRVVATMSRRIIHRVTVLRIVVVIVVRMGVIVSLGGSVVTHAIIIRRCSSLLVVSCMDRLPVVGGRLLWGATATSSLAVRLQLATVFLSPDLRFLSFIRFYEKVFQNPIFLFLQWLIWNKLVAFACRELRILRLFFDSGLFLSNWNHHGAFFNDLCRIWFVSLLGPDLVLL